MPFAARAGGERRAEDPSARSARSRTRSTRPATTSCTPRTASRRTRCPAASAPSTTSTRSRRRSSSPATTARSRGPTALVTVSRAVAAEVEAGWGPYRDRHPERRRRGAVRRGGRPGRERRPRRVAAAVRRVPPRRRRHRAAQGHDRRARGLRARRGAGTATCGSSSRAARRCSTTRGTAQRFDARRRASSACPSTCSAPVDHAALPSLVAAARAVPFLSTKEGFGLSAMEALAAGVPVVARDLPVIREVFGRAVERVPDDAAVARAASPRPSTAPSPATARRRSSAAPWPPRTAGTRPRRPTRPSTRRVLAARRMTLLTLRSAATATRRPEA